jgi:hypothetical protein
MVGQSFKNTELTFIMLDTYILFKASDEATGEYLLINIENIPLFIPTIIN